MTHDVQIHNLMHELMSAHTSAHLLMQRAGAEEDIQECEEMIQAAKDGASHLLKGEVQQAKDCLKMAKRFRRYDDA